jgi:hypothetical protein
VARLYFADVWSALAEPWWRRRTPQKKTGLVTLRGTALTRPAPQCDCY